MNISLIAFCGIFLSAILGGVVQSTVGFGSAIVMLIFIPAFLPLISCTAITTFASLCMCIRVVWLYRKHVIAKLIPVSLLSYFIAANYGLQLALFVDAGKIKLAFGYFMLILAFYFIFASKRISIHISWITALLCGGISGLCNGLFGIGGPPMALFFLAAIPNDKYGYLGTAQCFFMLTGLLTTILRFANGIITIDMIPYLVASVVGILLGTSIGNRIVSKINIEQMQKTIYAVLAMSGLLTVLGIT